MTPECWLSSQCPVDSGSPRLTVSLCLLIDNLMIGRFLGEGALSAYGLAGPVLLIIGAMGSMLCEIGRASCRERV